MGFIQQQTLTLVHRVRGRTWGGRELPGELGGGEESCVEGRETRWWWWGARRGPGSKGGTLESTWEERVSAGEERGG